MPCSWAPGPIQGTAFRNGLQTRRMEAAALGMNALFFSIDGPGGVVFETKHAKRGTALSDGDTFFHKLDALHTLCAAAAQKGLAVYAVAQQANAENATYRDTVLADIRQRYATAGIAVPMAANGAQGPFSIYSTPQGTLAAVTPESVAQAGEFFLLTTSADFGGAVFPRRPFLLRRVMPLCCSAPWTGAPRPRCWLHPTRLFGRDLPERRRFH